MALDRICGRTALTRVSLDFPCQHRHVGCRSFSLHELFEIAPCLFRSEIVQGAVTILSHLEELPLPKYMRLEGFNCLKCVLTRLIAIEIHADCKLCCEPIAFVTENRERRAQGIIKKIGCYLGSIRLCNPFGAGERALDQLPARPWFIMQSTKELLQRLSRLLWSPRPPEKFSANCLSVPWKNLRQLVDVRKSGAVACCGHTFSDQ